MILDIGTNIREIHGKLPLNAGNVNTMLELIFLSEALVMKTAEAN